MISSFLRYFIELATLSIVLLPVNYYVQEELLKMDFSSLHYFSFIYFILLVTVIQIFLVRSLRNRPQKFVITFMASMGIKIFLSLMILVVIMYTGLNSSKEFAINFLVLYLVYSGFSIMHMQKVQKDFPSGVEKGG